MLYPLKFEPAYKSYLWGGRRLERLGKRLPEGKVAESWEISGHPDGLGHVGEGALSGWTIPELMREYGTALIGKDLPEASLATFPLLVKFIDATDRLSVQVHPDDAFAAVHENGGLGKNEMWVVLDAEPGASLVYGLVPGTTQERFSEAAQSGQLESCLQVVPAKAGDVFDIPAGLVHAIGAGLVIAEIQQSSNTTYRVFDYNRTDAAGNRRPLHVEKALQVIDFQLNPSAGAAEEPVADDQGTLRTILVSNAYFVVERLVISRIFEGLADGSRFQLLICLQGEATLSWDGGTTRIAEGDSFLIPASLGRYKLKGSLTALRAWVPSEHAG